MQPAQIDRSKSTIKVTLHEHMIFKLKTKTKKKNAPDFSDCSFAFSIAEVDDSLSHSDLFPYSVLNQSKSEEVNDEA